MTEKIHIGKEIERILHEQGHTVTWLAEQYGCSRIHMYRIFEKSSLDTAMLLRFSVLLHHDFFLLYSQHLSQQAGTTH